MENLSPNKAIKRLEKHNRKNSWDMATEYFHEKHITGLFSRFKREMVQESRAALQASITAEMQLYQGALMLGHWPRWKG